jgi:hypothetical protein
MFLGRYPIPIAKYQKKNWVLGIGIEHDSHIIRYGMIWYGNHAQLGMWLLAIGYDLYPILKSHQKTGYKCIEASKAMSTDP